MHILQKNPCFDSLLTFNFHQKQNAVPSTYCEVKPSYILKQLINHPMIEINHNHFKGILFLTNDLCGPNVP